MSDGSFIHEVIFAMGLKGRNITDADLFVKTANELLRERGIEGEVVEAEIIEEPNGNLTVNMGWKPAFPVSWVNIHF